MPSTMSEDLRASALAYHQHPRPGKLEIHATKPMATQRDLALAYSPGVAAPCELIAADPREASILTSRQNLVAVLSNGTAVLGLGSIGPLASKPVMEGKAVLFKKFAGLDCFDIEVNETNIEKLVDIIVALEPTFGGINLEDIKAPECFEVEERARARMKIPVFHDDQHGTAIIVAAAVTNGLEIAGKKLDAVKVVASGAGAAALACLNLLVSLGVKRENVFVCDIEGVVYEGRKTLMDRWKSVYAQKTKARKLADIIGGADVFLGLSAGGVLKPEMVATMAHKPLILALANPYPEILPDEALKAKPDAMICTGRSDFPNQVNNVLCFPYIFRGALDAGATTINEEMKLAAVRAIAQLAREAPSDVVARAIGTEARTFGAQSLIPSPFDPRLILWIAPAVAKAAMDTGVARHPIGDIEAYKDQLSRFVFRSGFIMKPLFQRAKEELKRVIYADGEDERVLRATQVVVEEALAHPILIGRPAVVEARLKRYGLSARPGREFELVNPDDDPRYRDYVADYVKSRRPLRNHSGCCSHPGAHQRHGDRGAGAGARRCPRHALRSRGPVSFAPSPHPRHCRSGAWGAGIVGDEPHHHLQGRLFSRRYPCQARPNGRGDRRHGDPVRLACAPLRLGAENRAALPFGFRRGGHADGPQDASCAWHWCAPRSLTSKSTARCRPTPRSLKSSAIRCCPKRGSAARRMC